MIAPIINENTKRKEYSNQEYNFAFDLLTNERVITRPNKSELYENIGVWITDLPIPPTSSTGEIANECATDGPEKTVFASKKTDQLNNVTDYLRQIEMEYQLTKEEIAVSGVTAYRVTGKRISAEPAPMPDMIDRVYLGKDSLT